MRGRGEEGSTLVEFALILPIFATLLLGVVTGGMALERQQQLTSAAQQAARFGATVPINQCAVAAACNSLSWAAFVQSIAVERSDGLAGTSQVCVALVNGPGSAPVALDSSHTTAGGTSPCFNDNSANTADRVQVSITRGDSIDAVVFAKSITLSATSVSLYEGSS